MTNFTPEHLLAFHYHELTAAEESATAEAIADNWVLQQKYEVIMEAAQRLDKAMQKAPHQAVSNVLEYGKAVLNLSVAEN